MTDKAKLVVLDDQGEVFDSVDFEVTDGTNARELATKSAVQTTRITGVRVDFADGTSKPIDVKPNRDDEGDFWNTPVTQWPVTLLLGGALVIAPKQLKLRE